jgi:hypothetical protein
MAGLDISCVVHVHSTYSDGTATVPDLLSAAREAGADAVLLTDHDRARRRRRCEICAGVRKRSAGWVAAFALLWYPCSLRRSRVRPTAQARERRGDEAVVRAS